MAAAAVPLGNTAYSTIMPAGVSGAGGTPASGTVPTNTSLPVTATSNVLNPTQVNTNNPFAAPGSVPPPNGNVPGLIPTTNPTGVQAGVPASGAAPLTLGGDLNATYGAGTGAAIGDVLGSLGTVNDQAVQATIANTDLAAGKQYANIQANEAASGVTANSSTAALAAGDFYSGVDASLNQTIGNMEVNEEDTLLSTLMQVGTDHGPDESTFDSVLGGIGDAFNIAGDIGSAATGIGDVVSGIKSGGSLLDSLGGL